MATSRQTDVSLVIRARDEASRAVKAIDSALTDLFGTAKQGGAAAGSIGQLVSQIANLDKAYAQSKGSTDTAIAATQRHIEAAARNGAQLESLRRQLDAARASQERFNNSIGPKNEAQQQRYALVGVEIKSLERNIRDLEREIGKQDGQFARSTSSLAEMARQQKLAGAVATFAAQESQEYARALEAQAIAADKAATAAAMQANASRFGDTRGGKSAALSAEVFRAEGLTSYERQIQAERDLAQAIELSNNALRARGRIDGNGGSTGKASDTAFAEMLRQEQAAADAAAAELNTLAAAGARLRGEMNPLQVIQDKLNRELAELPRIARAAKFSAEELAAAEKLLRLEADRAAQSVGRQGLAGGGKPTLFGLKPYELTNLGYQINDVVTQLASGTSLTQTLAQQGGQILQLFPRAGAAIVSALTNPAILAVVATIGAIVAGIKEVGNEADRVRQLGGILGLNADGGDYGAQALNDASEALDRYGMSAEEALSTVRVFIKEGVNPAAIESFGRSAQNLADIMGIDVKDAAEEVAKAFTGGLSQIEKLDEAYNFLTATQLEQIRTMYEEGRASEARTYAYSIFEDKAEDVANKSRGPWASAIRELGGAWRDFVEWLSDTAPIAAAGRALESLGKQVRALLKEFRGGNRELIERNIGLQETAIAEFDERLRANPGDMGAKYSREGALRQLALLRAELAKIDAAEGKIGDTVAEQVEARKKSSDALRRETITAKEKKTVSEAEAEARRKATEHVETNFALADEALKKAYIEQEVTEARTKALKAAADERKRAADEAARERKEQERLAKQTKFTNPVSGGVSSGFGPRKSPGGVGSKYHKGTDFAVPVGTTVRAPADGVVIEIGTDAKLGKYVVIDHGKNVQSKFGHLSDTSTVSEGDVVSRGDAVAKSGNTGSATTGAHLHWQVTVNGKPVDSQKGTFPLDGAQRFEINPGEALEDFDTLTDQRNEKADEFLRKLQAEAAQRAEATITMREQLGLQGDALRLAQRLQAEDEAEFDIRERFARFNEGLKPGQKALQLTEQMVDEWRKLAGEAKDATNAVQAFADARTTLDRPVDDLTALRDQLQQQIAYYQERGQTGLANQLDPQLDAVNEKLRQAIENAREFYTALAADPTAMAALGLTAEQIEAIKIKLDASAAAGQNLGYFMGIAGQQIAQVFASQATSAIDRFAQSVAEGRNVFGSLLDAFRHFAAEFLRQIAQMIIQQMIFNLVSSFMKSLGGGGGGGVNVLAPGGGIGGGLPGIKLHSGGVVGRHGTPTTGRPAWFSNAARYHTGGVAGLAPNEIPAILQRGEEVLTRSDPRHRDNGGGAGVSPIVNLKNINVIDSADMLDQALMSPRGEKRMLNFIRSNSNAVKSALG